MAITASKHLKTLGKLWGSSCRSMWMEIAALRELETRLRTLFGTVQPRTKVTALVYTPECNGRLNDSIEAVLSNAPLVISHVVTLRVVMLSAALEDYFESFLDAYLHRRRKYSSGSALTSEGNRTRTAIMKERGPTNRITKFAGLTGASTQSLAPHLNALEEVYVLRNCIAHDAGICDLATHQRITLIPTRVGEPLRVDPEPLVRDLADPCMKVAKALDERI